MLVYLGPEKNIDIWKSSTMLRQSCGNFQTFNRVTARAAGSVTMSVAEKAVGWAAGSVDSLAAGKGQEWAAGLEVARTVGSVTVPVAEKAVGWADRKSVG